MSAVTYRRVVHEVVDPELDAIALNQAQARALDNRDTPEVDSLLEYIETLRGCGLAPRVCDELERYGWLLVELNGREGSFARTVAGNGEQIARDLRPVAGRQSLKRPALRRMLAPILDVLADVDLDDPRRDFDGLIAALERVIPAQTLRSRSLLHELGRTRCRTLLRLLREDGPR
ncbi:MAG TPA: hypothetical protein VFF79_12635 [Conexibacter sp.]|nr:hypothetical protein [Conexibacter sp.]